MDKFPVFWKGKAVGELIVEKESLYASFTVHAALPQEGFWAAWLIGNRGKFRLGILEPEGGIGMIRRRFSDRMIAPLGTVLQGELCEVTSNRTLWETILNPGELFHSYKLPKELAGIEGHLRRQGDFCCWIAVPYDKGKGFPLVEMFCFSNYLRMNGQAYLTFCFDREGQIIFGEAERKPVCFDLEKN